MAADRDPPDAAGRTRLEALRGWAQGRLAQCRRDEAALGPRAPATYEAVAERRALTTVFEILGWPLPPRDEADLHGRGTAAAAQPLAGPRGAHAHRRRGS